jgi:hypothetical protein
MNRSQNILVFGKNVFSQSVVCPKTLWAVAWIQGSPELTQFKGKESVGTQQRRERHDEGHRRTHSGRGAGGSAANRVKRLPVHYIRLLINDS